jgi:hypothetical protein
MTFFMVIFHMVNSFTKSNLNRVEKKKALETIEDSNIY